MNLFSKQSIIQLLPIKKRGVKMKILLIGLALMTSLTGINSYAECETNTKSRVNNGYFWIEAIDFSRKASFENGRDFTGSFEADIHETSGSFQRKYSQDSLWGNSYENSLQAYIHISSVIEDLLYGHRYYNESYYGASEDLIEQFMKEHKSISYCEVSKLIQKYIRE
jgi:hypothetical protein